MYAPDQRMLEPDVALTDFLLTLECAAFAASLWRRAASWLQMAFAAFFTAIAVSALLGGLVHGYYPETSSLFKELWAGTLLSLGVAAAAAWLASAQILLPRVPTRWIIGIVAFAFALYAWVVVAIRSEFKIAILNYLPAVVLLTVAFVIDYSRYKETALLLGSIGFALTYAAAAVQQLRLSLAPPYFDHNASYHLIQAIALALIFIGARRCVAIERTRNAIAA